LIFATYPTVHWGTYAPQLPQAWTLGAELTFYLFAPFLLRSLRASLAVLLVSLAVRAVLVATIGHVDAWTYHFLPATACFFLLGHFAQLAGRRFEVVRRGEFGAVMLAVAVVVSLRFYPQFDDPAFWVATLAFAAALPGVFHATKDSHWLNALGDLSYPVYLTHLFVIGFLFGPNRLQALAFVGDAITSFAARVAAPLDVRGGVTALCVGLICCLAAVVVHHAVERPVARLMHAVLRRSAWADAKFAAGQPEGLAPR